MFKRISLAVARLTIDSPRLRYGTPLFGFAGKRGFGKMRID
jgi:hypothetical protein